MESGDNAKCSADVGEGAYYMAGVVAINAIMATVLLLSGLFHSLLRRLGQPSIISHILAGVVVGPTFLGRVIDLRAMGMEDAGTALGDTIYYLRIIFMFFIGLEMDLRYLRHNLRRSLLLACGGSAISLLLAAVAGPFFYGLLHPMGHGESFHPAKLYASTVLFMLVLASTASPVLIRIVTELKLTASETGQLAIGAAFATDIACLTTISMMVVNPTTFAKDGTPKPPRVPGASTPGVQLLVFLWMALVVWVAVAVAVRAARLLNRVKRGRRYISKYELCAMLLLIVGLSLLVQYLRYSASMAAFLIGLAMPRDGPMARTLIDRLTYPVHQIVMPLCFGAIGARLDFADAGRFTATQLTAAIVFTTVLSAAGKVGGTVLVGRWLGITAREALVLGFLLNVKGYSDILAINFGDKSGVWGDTAQVVLLVSSILNTFMAGPASAAIVRQQRRAFQYRSHCLQDLRVDHELRVLVCVHGAGGVNAMLTVAELSKGSGAPVAVYLLHLVELMPARKYAITHLYKDVGARLKLNDDDQWGYAWEMDQVAAAVHSFATYEAAVPVRQMTAISNLASMDGDVRNGVEDARASLVIMPYHKEQRYDGRMVSRRDGRRQLNQRILQRAPCTVGVLVERHLPSISVASSTAPAEADRHDEEEKSTASGTSLAEEQAEQEAAVVHHVVAVFLGGPDDREAVAYATRLAMHPSVSVSVSRFRLNKPDDNEMQTAVDVTGDEQEQEDEEFMAEVYARFVAPGRVSYTETYVSNGVETLNALSGMAGMCSLFVVGRGGGGSGGAAWTTMTSGMGGLDDEECPELGPVGELLASDDFLGCSSSVLVLQQHKLHQKMRTWKKHSLDGCMPDHDILNY
ncbi:cation/H(+) antiporter 2-like [Lolium rigidum]|uniref:cation/H(+) antiporter 2-like n=1 Tax=Lolium rigidum TaxID=89674 RepID=UPI001F5E2DCD|nr:cation/H(+) antiporter 2-like [Lolium rigidum]